MFLLTSKNSSSYIRKNWRALNFFTISNFLITTLRHNLYIKGCGKRKCETLFVYWLIYMSFLEYYNFLSHVFQLLCYFISFVINVSQFKQKRHFRCRVKNKLINFHSYSPNLLNDIKLFYIFIWIYF